MLPNINYRHIKNIKFPVYSIPEEDLEYRDGLVTSRGLVIDDKNMAGDTLGKRRLQSPHRLFRLKRGYEDFASMIQSKKTTFIDSKGQFFRYDKSIFVPLKYHKIKKIERKEIASLLWAAGVESPFLIKRPPPASAVWVGILYFKDFPWTVYEYTTQKVPDTRRKI